MNHGESTPQRDHDELQRWRGRIDASVESISKSLDELWNNFNQFRDKYQMAHASLEREVQKLNQEFTNFTSKATVWIALASFLGTMVTSLLVTTIVKLFVK